MLYLHCYYFIREAGRLQSPNEQPLKSQEGPSLLWQAKKTHTRKLSVAYQMYKGKDPGGRACLQLEGLFIYLVTVMHTTD